MGTSPFHSISVPRSIICFGSVETNMLSEGLALVHAVSSPVLHLSGGKFVQESKNGNTHDGLLVLVREQGQIFLTRLDLL